MKTYWHALLESFYNPAIYREAVQKWQGFGGLYMVFLSFILAIFVTISFLISIHHFEKGELQHLVKQVPEITIQKGIVSVKDDKTAIITNTDKTFTITIDTSKTESELNNTKTQVGVGRDFIFMRSANGEYQLLDMSKLKDKVLHINQKSLMQMWHDNIGFVKITAFPLLWIGQFGGLLATCLFGAFLSYFVTAFMPEEYIFITRMRLVVLALTPAEIISNIVNISLNHQTAPWFVTLLAMLYFYVMLVLMRRLPPSDDAPAVVTTP